MERDALKIEGQIDRGGARISGVVAATLIWIAVVYGLLAPPLDGHAHTTASMAFARIGTAGPCLK